MNKTVVAWLGLLALVAVLPLAGCGGVGWLAQFAPPQEVKAIYKPPEDKTVLVFVDDVLNPVSYEPIKGDLTERINEKFITHKVAAATVSYGRMMQLRSSTPNFDRLSVSEVGQKLQADLVLYVHIDKFSLKDDAQSPLWHGRLQATVRLVDANAGRLWPDDRPEGYAMPEVETEPADNSSAAYGDQVAKELATQMAERIAEIFYDHTVPVALEPSGK